MTSTQSGGETGGSRPCACGCELTLDGLRANARYATPACRTRGWKARTGYTDQRARKASPRRQHAQGSKSGPQLSYRKAITAVAAHLATRRVATPELVAEAILQPALPEAQRQRLAQRAPAPHTRVP